MSERLLLLESSLHYGVALCGDVCELTPRFPRFSVHELCQDLHERLVHCFCKRVQELERVCRDHPARPAEEPGAVSSSFALFYGVRMIIATCFPNFT